MTDPLIAQSQEIREQLTRQFGGLDGLCDQIEQMDRERANRTSQPPSRRSPQSSKATAPSRKKRALHSR